MFPPSVGLSLCPPARQSSSHSGCPVVLPRGRLTFVDKTFTLNALLSCVHCPFLLHRFLRFGLSPTFVLFHFVLRPMSCVCLQDGIPGILRIVRTNPRISGSKSWTLSAQVETFALTMARLRIGNKIFASSSFIGGILEFLFVAGNSKYIYCQFWECHDHTLVTEPSAKCN